MWTIDQISDKNIFNFKCTYPAPLRRAGSNLASDRGLYLVKSVVVFFSSLPIVVVIMDLYLNNKTFILSFIILFFFRSYEHYCRCGKQIDAKLKALGAVEFVGRHDVDKENYKVVDSWI